MSKRYKIVAIGSGFGGLQSAVHGSLRGVPCAIIEKGQLGGECTHSGCIPTKSLIRSVDTYRLARNASTMGINIQGDIRIRLSDVINRQKEIVNQLVNGISKWFNDMGIDYYHGVGTIIHPKRVKVELIHPEPGQREDISLETENIIIGTGSVPKKLAIPGADLPRVFTNRELLNIKNLPKSIVIIGCSYVGVEFGTIFSMMGTQVTMLGRRTFLKDFDQKLAQAVQQRLIQYQGVSIEVGLEILGIQENNERVYDVMYEKDGKRRSAQGEIVLMATSRNPYTTDLLDKDIKIRMNDSAIAVNERMETSVPGIYAVGDVLNGLMLAYSAASEGEVAADNCLGKKALMDYSIVPRCVFTYPELARVGLTEEEAKSVEGLDFGVVEYPFQTTPMARIMNEMEGFTRLIYEKGSGRILGGHILGPHASELIGQLSLAIRNNMSVEELAHLLHFHPSLSENLQRVARAGLLLEELRR